MGARFCCAALADEVEKSRSGQIEQADDGSWNVNGCCGGGCYVLDNIKFCPFCGTGLPAAAVKPPPWWRRLFKWSL